MARSMPTASSSGATAASSPSRSPSWPVADSPVERLADVLVGYSAGVRPGDLVQIESSELAAPLIRAVYARVLDAGGHPEVSLGVEGLTELLLGEGSDEQLTWISPARRESLERADVWIRLDADVNTRTLSGTDPARQTVA